MQCWIGPVFGVKYACADALKGKLWFSVDVVLFSVIFDVGVFGELGLGSYRGRLDIIADVLRVVSQNAKKTQIMYQANLSYKVLKRYLKEVSEASLVEFECGRRCYVLTAKGRAFLEAYKEYSRGNKHLERRLNEINGKKKLLESLCSNR